MILSADIKKTTRNFVANTFEITTWEQLTPYFEELKNRTIGNVAELEKLIYDSNELQAVISEDACWRQIKMTCNTEEKSLEESFTYFCMEIEPKIKPYSFLINKKIADSTFAQELDSKKYYVYIRGIENAIRIYNEKNNGLEAEIAVLAQQYGSISAKMSIVHEEKEYTMQQAAVFLMQSNRELRKEIYNKIVARRAQDVDTLHTLFNTLTEKRNQIALHSGFANYRDYKFVELGRFDYTVNDCEQFHEAVKKYIVPIVENIYEYKRKKLGLTALTPYDIEAEPIGTEPLKPFIDGKELLEKSIDCFEKLHPFFADCLRKMQGMQQLDLDSRKGKAPGGYNCPLAETGVPFIFMNAASTADDVVTMMHEGGHAIHSFLSHSLEISGFKEYPMEIAELASMSMELFSMEHWDTFYKNDIELMRAKQEELERALAIFPWIAIIDKFQHWIYTHPQHSIAEREAMWLQIHNEFSPKNIDWTGYENYRKNLWQKQLHVFEVPFYYIEYGIAQLGAIAMWQQFKKDKEQTLQNYMLALSKGYTIPLKELYTTAGIAFDFSEQNIEQLSSFINKEMEMYFV